MTEFEPINLGSSPRGRGKPSDAASDAAMYGLIPAWAGKTQARRGRNAAAGAHPRVGGENVAAESAASCAAGSSPRGRGKQSTWPARDP